MLTYIDRSFLKILKIKDRADYAKRKLTGSFFEPFLIEFLEANTKNDFNEATIFFVGWPRFQNGFEQVEKSLMKMTSMTHEIKDDWGLDKFRQLVPTLKI